MNTQTNLVVMLTKNDRTVMNAADCFEACKNSQAQYWGFKEEPLPLNEMQQLYSYMQECGKTTVLEVVAYQEDECLHGAQVAAACGVDILMGTIFFDSVNELCLKHGIKYMPFVGTVTERPSVLSGDVTDMIAQAREYVSKGAYGVDLLAYRYVGDQEELIRTFCAQVDAPVCLAGSVNSFDRLDSMKANKPWGFTIGGAFFDNAFGQDMATQIDTVLNYVQSKDDE